MSEVFAGLLPMARKKRHGSSAHRSQLLSLPPRLLPPEHSKAVLSLFFEQMLRASSIGRPNWEDLNLQIGDGILITYLGRNMFKVRIFDMEGLEKVSQHRSISPVVDGCPSEAYNKESLPEKVDSNIHVYDDVGLHDQNRKLRISNNYNAKLEGLENIRLSALKDLDKKTQDISRKSFVEDPCDRTGVLNDYSLGIHGISESSRRCEGYGASITCSDRSFCEPDSTERGSKETICGKSGGITITNQFGDRKEDFMCTEHEAHQRGDCEPVLIGKVIKYERPLPEDLQKAALLETAAGLSKHKASDFCDKQNIFQSTWPLADRWNISEMARQRLIIEANAFMSPFPIARKSLKPSFGHKMVLPKLFVEKFMPKRVASLTLTDPQGENWPCRWLGAMNSMAHFVPCISAGWSQFARNHQLKTNDILVFELIEHQSLHFKVHIFKPQALDVLSHHPFLSTSISKTKYH
ncbi:hypothetical protein GOP47_0011361 [Adiantum capillus-veneris]|uniref:TF-B3 domain-containing protein n=1 Tax=Adiantum capillus-veneris TaxID=13818 RepID=A0A9D4USN0_ADICA|nr:hypothetical protein GOP47_0011361 [Adiantum capillus-veneris]